ncbi:MAG: HyaD/HybD family hydrogenase maturation endopeptidase [bacterium]|nr:HyaD/HybD family hydrogenase maturation endopeptidase [bacterium]
MTASKKPGFFLQTAILVLGLGNILLRDEGVGVRVIERLQEKYEFPEGVQVLDGGTGGLALSPYLEGVKRLLVVDAVAAGKEPGSLTRLEGKDVPSFLGLKLSPHQEGLADLLITAHLTGLYPEEVVLWGVEPAVVDTGLELSPPVAARVDELVEKVGGELRRWEVEVRSFNGSYLPFGSHSA